VDRPGLVFLGTDQQQVVDRQADVALRSRGRAVERQPAGTFEQEVAGAVEGFAERSGPRDDACGDSPGGVGLDSDRHPRLPLSGQPSMRRRDGTAMADRYQSDA
jgi:hypothetical protein